MNITLHTRDGEFVAEVQIPPYKVRPEAVSWGGRIFVRREEWNSNIHSGKYYEAFVATGISLNQS